MTEAIDDEKAAMVIFEILDLAIDSIESLSRLLVAHVQLRDGTWPHRYDEKAIQLLSDESRRTLAAVMGATEAWTEVRNEAKRHVEETLAKNPSALPFPRCLQRLGCRLKNGHEGPHSYD